MPKYPEFRWNSTIVVLTLAQYDWTKMEDFVFLNYKPVNVKYNYAKPLGTLPLKSWDPHKSYRSNWHGLHQLDWSIKNIKSLLIYYLLKKYIVQQTVKILILILKN